MRVAAFAMTMALAAAACGGGDDGSAAGAMGLPPGHSAELDAATGDLPTDEFEMSDGTSVTFDDLLDGRPLVVNYFASWCPVCRAEMPGIAAVHADAGDAVRFTGVAMQDEPADAAELVELTGVRYEWGLDPTGAQYATFGGYGLPTTFYVSPDGEILGQDNGFLDEGALRDRLEDLFGVTV